MASLEAFLTETPQNIRLILGGIYCLGYEFSAFMFIDDGIVPGSDEFAIECVSSFEKRIPLDVGIAQYAGVRSSSGQVFIDKIVDDIVSEFFTDINDEVVETHVNSNLPCVVDGIKAAAAGFLL
jgi:hypothetical protein